MSPRLAVATLGAVLAFGAAILLGTAASDRRATAFSLDIGNTDQVVKLFPGQSACQAPIDVPAAFRSIQLSVLSSGPTTVSVAVSPAGAGGGLPAGRPLAAGAVNASPALTSARTVALNGVVAAGRPVAVCVDDRGPGAIGLLGSAPIPSSGELEVAGQRIPHAIAMVFLRPAPPTFLSMLPTVFQRAALFKAGWIGAWTFWLLSAALLGAFALAARALAQAAREDARSSRHTTAQ